MPMYEYKCRECGVKFEILRGISSTHEDIKCPKCCAEKPERLLSVVCGSTSGGTGHGLNKGNLRFPT
jgi:putative FmdB family regulatory protein